ncbi:hypothetical protein Tsubulata_033101 [Turnera subulata]|uniref:Acyl-coenzyme A thioesterase 13 n=1 Tax=Turnera subulata TaxID=218843 RepID=A0A9Q0F4M2_9ROSI|nr:hypothetical protein Tsubulata_033101 [Turnera subulata]
MEEDAVAARATKLLYDISKGAHHEIEAIALGGVKVVEAYKGYFRCSFVVTELQSDGNGNWSFGAMATLVDNVGQMGIYTLTGDFRVSVDFTMSFFSTAKIQEEVELEAKVVGNIERITSVVVEVRRKSNGELIALGKQWMAAKSNLQRVVSNL